MPELFSLLVLLLVVPLLRVFAAISESRPLSSTSGSQIKSVSAMCNGDGITAEIAFDHSFGGKVSHCLSIDVHLQIYSFDYPNIHECIYYNTQEMDSVLFSIPAHRCGTRITRNTRNVVDLMENRVYVQMDKDTQTMADRQYAFVCQMTGTNTSSSPSQSLINTKWNPAIDVKTPIEATISRSRPVLFNFNNNNNNNNNNYDGRIQPVIANFRINPTPRPFPWNNEIDHEHRHSSTITTTSTTITSSIRTQPKTVIAHGSTVPYNIVVKTQTVEPLKIFATQQPETDSQQSRDAISKAEDLVTLEIQQGDGPYAGVVHKPIRIGETITLVVRSLVVSRNKHNIFVHSCFAADGPGSTKVELIDDAGCVVRPQVVGEMRRTHSPNGESVYFFRIHAFKFPGPNDVYFTCSVDMISDDELLRDICPSNNNETIAKETTRQKRDVHQEKKQHLAELADQLTLDDHLPKRDVEQDKKQRLAELADQLVLDDHLPKRDVDQEKKQRRLYLYDSVEVELVDQFAFDDHLQMTREECLYSSRLLNTAIAAVITLTMALIASLIYLIRVALRLRQLEMTK